MATTTKIHVTATDNELYIIAVPSGGRGSFEICHITSGFNNPVDYTVVPQSILPTGSYTLVMVGINWGGPQAFKVILTTGGADTPFTAPAGTTVGCVWCQNVPMTV
jgi:chemotaxis response regulator CheB